VKTTKKMQIAKHKFMVRDKGFTLVEVMIAVAILAAGVLAVGTMQSSSVAGNSLAGNTTEATTLAEDTLEMLLGLPWNHAFLQDTTNDGATTLRNPLPPLPNPPVPDMAARPPEYQRQAGRFSVCWNVANNLAVNNTRTINVIVAWQQGSEAKAVVLEYIKARDDLFL
jgi:prepilin-type N-terminal cleavage/methylation domain-containing protein